MNARRAFAFIIAALVLGMLIVLAGVALGRMTAAAPQTTDMLPVRLDMPLDAQGRGSQRVANVDLAYAIAPYPAQAGAPAEVILTARDLRPGSAREIRGTLEVAALDGPVDGAVSEFKLRDGQLVAPARFDVPGEYRLRARLEGIFPDEAYVTLIVVRVE